MDENMTSLLDPCADSTAFPESVTYEFVSRVVNGPVTLFVAIVGCAGNVHSMRVVRRFRISKVLTEVLAYFQFH
jgi:hypothetical protein